MRPRVICHMAMSIDGRIVSDGWPDSPAVRREYEEIHASYDADAWMCGRITMEPFAGAVRSDAEVNRFVAGSFRFGQTASKKRLVRLIEGSIPAQAGQM